MSTRPTSHQDLVDILRAHPPELDELTRARIEKRLLAAASAPRDRQQARRGAKLAAAALLAVAAAVLVAVLASMARDDEEAAPVARFERREAAFAIERGTLEDGSTLRTAEDEIAQLDVGGSRVRIGGRSRVRLARLAREQVVLALDRGSLDVAFHPRERGRERLTIETPDARVEVVGTVFRVTTDADATEVSVIEGVVRVVPIGGGAPRSVGAGASTRIARSRGDRAEPETPDHAASAEAAAAPDLSAPRASSPEAIAREPAALSPPASPSDRVAPSDIVAPEAHHLAPGRSPSPAERLEEAQRLLDGQDVPAAARILRELTRPSVPVEVRTEAWMLSADMHTHAGRFEDAARAYENAAREGRGTAHGQVAIFSLARHQHRRLGDLDAARASYARYLVEAPDGPLAHEAKRALCALDVREHCEASP